ncbi:hypothetical protein OpiT1DRAFT_04831 [Opitutaceae bacterium TAV1]|nr:hypothetical protein OpiT1DRAFT_04831 [Opitutaceae bacterium TAV1]
MTVNWYLLVGGLVAAFIPARLFVSPDSRPLELLQIRAMRIDKSRRRRRWWKARQIWLEPLRGAAAAFCLRAALTPAPESGRAMHLLVVLIVLAILVVSVTLQTLGGKPGASRYGDDDDNDGKERESDAAAGSRGSRSSRRRRNPDVTPQSLAAARENRPLTAPLLFLAGMALGLPVTWPIGNWAVFFVGSAAIVIGIFALKAFHYWGMACLLGGIVAMVIGYVVMGKSLYVPGLALLIMEPALLAWYFHRGLVMPVRI